MNTMALHSETDNEIIRRVLNGETEHFERLVRPHRTKVLALVRFALRNSPDAEDVTQDILTKAFTKLYQFRGEAQFRTWLFRIAFNEIRQYQRHAAVRAQVDLGDGEFVEENSDVYMTLEREHMRNAVIQVLQQLAEPMRNVLHCYHIMGLSISATARHLGLKETAAKTRLFRARQHMHKVWESSYGTWGKR